MKGGCACPGCFWSRTARSRDGLARHLKRKGYDPHGCRWPPGVGCGSGRDAGYYPHGHDLPVLDGWEATCQLKAAPETCAIPVIALTAHAMAGDREKALEAGCDDYDTKPVEFARLLAKIESLLRKKAARGRRRHGRAHGVKGQRRSRGANSRLASSNSVPPARYTKPHHEMNSLMLAMSEE